jgi:hypothetical protein
VHIEGELQTAANASFSVLLHALLYIFLFISNANDFPL